jgi:hypothetical protein
MAMGITAAEIAALKSSCRFARDVDVSTEGLVQLCFGGAGLPGGATIPATALPCVDPQAHPLCARDDDEDEDEDGDDEDDDQDDDDEDEDGDEDDEDDEGDDDEGDDGEDEDE